MKYSILQTDSKLGKRIGYLLHIANLKDITTCNNDSALQILKETSIKMYTPFQIGFNLQYGPYAHFGY